MRPAVGDGSERSAWRALTAHLRALLAAEQRHGRALETDNSQMVTRIAADAADHTRTDGEHRREVAGLRAEVSDGQARTDVATGLHRRGVRRERALTAQLLVYGKDLARLYDRTLGRRRRVPVLLVVPLVALAFLAGAVSQACLPAAIGGERLPADVGADAMGIASGGTAPLDARGRGVGGSVVVASSGDGRTAIAGRGSGVACMCLNDPAPGSVADGAVRAEAGQQAAPRPPPDDLGVGPEVRAAGADPTGRAPTTLPARTAVPAPADEPTDTLPSEPLRRAAPSGVPSSPSAVDAAARQRPPSPEGPRVAAAPGPAGTRALEIILDASGSMRDPLGGGGTKISQAKAATGGLIASLPDGVNLGLRVYGPRVAGQDGNACGGVELLHSVAPVNRGGLAAAVAGVQPEGPTPLARSLSLAGRDFPPGLVRGHVVLITDGEETCGGDPVAAARALRSNTPPLLVHVLGFGVAPAEQVGLRAVAQAGGGAYRDVASEADLRDALARLVASIMADSP